MSTACLTRGKGARRGRDVNPRTREYRRVKSPNVFVKAHSGDIQKAVGPNGIFVTFFLLRATSTAPPTPILVWLSVSHIQGVGYFPTISQRIRQNISFGAARLGQARNPPHRLLPTPSLTYLLHRFDCQGRFFFFSSVNSLPS